MSNFRKIPPVGTALVGADRHDECDKPFHDYANALKKVKFPPSQRRRHKRGAEAGLHSFFNSALDGCERSTSRSGLFIPEKESPTHWTGDWVFLRVALVCVFCRREESLTLLHGRLYWRTFVPRPLNCMLKANTSFVISITINLTKGTLQPAQWCFLSLSLLFHRRVLEKYSEYSHVACSIIY